jgi:hypothetical protein
MTGRKIYALCFLTAWSALLALGITVMVAR